MKHTIERIIKRLPDYKQCADCKAMNFKANVLCVECRSDVFLSELDIQLTADYLLERFTGDLLMELNV